MYFNQQPDVSLFTFQYIIHYTNKAPFCDFKYKPKTLKQFLIKHTATEITLTSNGIKLGFRKRANIQ
jgi:hypothetical protein